MSLIDILSHPLKNHHRSRPSQLAGRLLTFMYPQATENTCSLRIDQTPRVQTLSAPLQHSPSCEEDTAGDTTGLALSTKSGASVAERGATRAALTG